MRRDAEDCAAPLTATVLPVPLQKPKTVSRGGSGPAGRREREKNAVERASIAADRAENGGTFHPGRHSNIRASSAISRAQGESRQAAAWRRLAVPGTERRGHLPCAVKKEMFLRVTTGPRRTQASSGVSVALTNARGPAATPVGCTTGQPLREQGHPSRPSRAKSSSGMVRILTGLDS